MFRNINYSNKDMSLRCCFVVIKFNFWQTFKKIGIRTGELDEKRCLNINCYGLDLHVYNRSSLYDQLKYKIEKSATDADASEVLGSLHQDQPSLLSAFWKEYETLFPAVRFELAIVRTKICFGNSLLPRALMLTCSKMRGVYYPREATHKADEMQNYLKSDFEGFAMSLVQTVQYRGHYNEEESVYKNKKVFVILELGKGNFVYMQDEPGMVTHEPDAVFLRKDNESPALCRTWPEWKLHFTVDEKFHINYGPWIDRNREILYKFFYPPSFETMKVDTMPVSSNKRRVFQNFELRVNSNTDFDLKVPFLDSKQSQKASFYLF
ncbi:hypothetical protein Ciccas_003120 [Cichlidogyrus casuarinus]|uniref:Bridge-like lipid transfer protein family member 1 N-terminal domain-containing protein n=1 Tax=Cichlidogyrus casuarinus TaxID=1844966 RepID=A0ABD2QFE0_9PLAT